MITENVKKLGEFLDNSPTAFHSVKNLEEMLRAAGFTALNENEKWNITAGGKYYVTRNRSSIIAFTMPENGEFTSFQMAASHSDSPTFKIKEHQELAVNDKYIRLDVENYGGAILFTWMDRPLGVAGRVVVKTPAGIETRLVDLKRDCAIIPNVPIHMSRTLNDGFKPNPAVDLVPLWSDGMGKGSFITTIAKEAGCNADDIVGTDLFLYPRVKTSVWGNDDEFISSARLDDLECAFTSMEALIKTGCIDNHVNVCCVFDNEEVGSRTKQGADSTLLYDTLHRICYAAGKNDEDYMILLSSSFMLSCDNAHAVHPNHPELCDAINRTYMNEGIVIKFNAMQKYTTDGVSAAAFHRICENAKVPLQHFANRSDMPGGGTLGNISSANVSVNTLDIGLPQLAMHSSYETAGTKDVDYMIDGVSAFFTAGIKCLSDGNYDFT